MAGSILAKSARPRNQGYPDTPKLVIPNPQFNLASLMRNLFYLENDENDVVLLELALRKVGCKDPLRWFRRSSELKAALLNLSPAEFPKIIMVDLLLDGEYGLQTIEWLGAQPLFRHIPAFIFSSGRIMPEIAAVLEQNAAGYLFKPSRLDAWRELAGQLKEMIQCPIPPAIHRLKSDRLGAEETIGRI